MLYVIYGTDTDTAREKSRALFDALKTKKPDASAGTISPEEVTVERLQELTQTQGLFENKQIILMNRTLEKPDIRELILPLLDSIHESPNIFIFSEGKLTKEVLKKLEKRAEKVQEYILDESPKPKETSSVFLMADALSQKDKKKLWVMLRNAFDADVAAEEIHGILFWQMKSLYLAQTSANAGEAGLNPFVYNKAKKSLQFWNDGEVSKMLSDLVHMYHNAHRGKVNFEHELEKLALSL